MKITSVTMQTAWPLEITYTSHVFIPLSIRLKGLARRKSVEEDTLKLM